MDELTIGDKIYISSKKAAKITGYAKDYIGQLCREGRVEARLVGRNWYVLESSIREHRFGKETTSAALPIEPEQAPESFTSTWQQPVYAHEEATALIPVIQASKTPQEAASSAPPVSDMQAAWREWFQTREASVATNDPEAMGSSETDGSGVAMNEQGTYALQESGGDDTYEESSDISSNEAIFGGPVVPAGLHAAEEIDQYEELHPEEDAVLEYELAIRPDHAIDTPLYSVQKEDEENPISLNRVREAERAYAPTTLPRRPKHGRTETLRTRRARRSYSIMQAVFVGVAGVALAIGLVGSGIAETVLGTNSALPKYEGPLIDLIQGERIYK